MTESLCNYNWSAGNTRFWMCSTVFGTFLLPSWDDYDVKFFFFERSQQKSTTFFSFFLNWLEYGQSFWGLKQLMVVIGKGNFYPWQNRLVVYPFMLRITVNNGRVRQISRDLNYYRTSFPDVDDVIPENYCISSCATKQCTLHIFWHGRSTSGSQTQVSLIHDFFIWILRHYVFLITKQLQAVFGFCPGAGDGGDTRYEGLIVEAPPERCTVFRPQVYERVLRDFTRWRYMKGNGNLSFGSVKGPKRAKRWMVWLY